MNTKRNKIIAREVNRQLAQAQVDTATRNAPTLPRGIKFYFMPNEWWLPLGFEVQARPGIGLPRLDIYTGVGPAMVRVTL